MNFMPWESGIDSGNSSPTRGKKKIPRCICQEDLVSPTDICNSINATQPVTLEKFGERSYKFTKSQEKINYLLYMDDIKIKKNRRLSFKQ